LNPPYRLLLFDLMNVMFRWHHVMAKKPLVYNGVDTSAVHGFLYTALTLIQRYNPDYVAVCAEGGADFRRKNHPEYKAQRPPKPPAITLAEPIVEQLCRGLGLAFVRLQGAEADDVIATYASKGDGDGAHVWICSADKDLSQLVSPRVTQLQPTCRGSGYLELDVAAVEAKWGVAPKKIPEVLALMGDAVDNVPGITGIGEKGAKRLIQKYGTALEVFQRRAELPERLRHTLEAEREDLVLSRWLVEVQRDLYDLLPPLDDLHWEMPKLEQVGPLLDVFGLNVVKDLLASHQPAVKGWRPLLQVPSP
jgi:DNA polymerase-1